MEIEKFFFRVNNPVFTVKTNLDILELVHFPNFKITKQGSSDILQNFTFLQLRELESKFKRFIEINLNRLRDSGEENSGLISFLENNLILSEKKIERLCRSAASEICKALAVYSGFLLKYDQVIKIGIESINDILVSEVSNIGEIIDQFLPLNFSGYKLPFS